MRLNQRINNFFHKKYVNKLLEFLKQGTSPKELALAVSIAFVLGIFPVIGSTTILCTLFGLAFRLNLPLIHLINYSVYPLQLVLLVPFMKIGEMIFGFEKLSIGLSGIIDMIKDNIFNAISVLWDVTLQGIGAWLITAPIIALILFAVIHPVFIKMESNLKKQNGN